MAFWRRKPLHQKLAEEGGLVPKPEPIDTRPPFEAGIHGLARPREWDAVVTVETHLAADTARFVALPDGTLLVESGEDDLEPLADALEGSLRPPYRAEAVRRGDGWWAVAGRALEVVEVAEEIAGDHVTITLRGGERTVELDGERVFGGLPTLERLGGDDAVVTAHRLDGALWEVEVSPL